MEEKLINDTKIWKGKCICKKIDGLFREFQINSDQTVSNIKSY